MSEGHSTRREAVDIRRLRLRILAEIANPIAQIVHGDEEHIGPLRLGRAHAASNEEIQGEREEGNGFHGVNDETRERALVAHRSDRCPAPPFPQAELAVLPDNG